MVSGLTPRVAFTNLDKVLFPEHGITKAALLAYYALAADWLLPHLKDRPLTLVRCPDGPRAGCFFQKHATPGVPAAIRRIPIREGGGASEEYLAISDRDGLLAAVQHGALELHVWGSRHPDVERPDRLVFDLDPDVPLPWEAVVEGALSLREHLEGLGLASWVKTTGGKGLHVVVPIERKIDWPTAKAFAKAVAESYSAGAPQRFTTNPLKAHRRGKIFVDYLRNARGATAIAPYSTRARARAPIATPLSWAELERGARPDAFDLTTVPERLRTQKKDPWRDMATTKQSITASMRRLVQSNAGRG